MVYYMIYIHDIVLWISELILDRVFYSSGMLILIKNYKDNYTDALNCTVRVECYHKIGLGYGTLYAPVWIGVMSCVNWMCMSGIILWAVICMIGDKEFVVGYTK